LTQINVSQDDKDRFDELKPSEKTQKEFFAEVIATYENAEETITLDTERLTERIKESVASEVELAAYRGVQESLENAQ
jgi:signal transduction histidine kinase